MWPGHAGASVLNGISTAYYLLYEELQKEYSLLRFHLWNFRGLSVLNKLSCSFSTPPHGPSRAHQLKLIVLQGGSDSSKSKHACTRNKSHLFDNAMPRKSLHSAVIVETIKLVPGIFPILTAVKSKEHRMSHLPQLPNSTRNP